MFSELPKLFDRNFAVGYLLPASILTAGSVYLLSAFAYLPQVTVRTLTEDNPWLGAATLGVVAWLTALLLLGANRSILRLKEGYGLLDVNWNPFKILERRRYRRLEEQIADLKSERYLSRQRGESPSARVRANLIKKGLRRAARFPDEERFLLPTAFGNTIRAFEVYPRVMYGVESTEIWSRLLAVVPKDYRDLVDLAKSQVDFWTNLWLVSWVVIGEYLLLRLVTGLWVESWLLITAVAVVPFASFWAGRVAVEWGRQVKACFDVFLPDLRKKLELSAEKGRDADREVWTRFSQAVSFQLPEHLPERDGGISKGSSTPA